MKYADPAAFRRALEDRLKVLAGGDGARLARDRKRVAFDRLLARLLVAAPDQWLLKGGFALDLRLAEQARATKDIDLEWHIAETELMDTLIDAATHDAGDFFSFSIERSATPADRLGGSHRFRVAASLANRQFETFVVDVGHRTEPITDAEPLTTSDLLTFAGIEPVTVPVVPLTQQVAEKLHAYTRIYEGGRASSRVKDLVDLALISTSFALDAAELSHALAATFAVRATHAVPEDVPAPPAEWRAPYRQLAQAIGIDDALGDGHVAAAALLNPVLAKQVTTGTWHPDDRNWTT